MFVVFEGIDGSGKTTVSNKVAAKLRARGIEINHIREGGEFASPLVRRMREFGKDTRNMSMAYLTELLFYVARDAQLLSENIHPALARGGVVFADRYLYSYEVLSHYGRGVPLETARPILDAVAGGVWPELVVLMDVDPFVARARRKVRKLAKKISGEVSGGGSRKGLGGIGVQHRLRDGYRALAARDPQRWLVVDNSDVNTGLDTVVDRVTEAIAALIDGTPAAAVVTAHQRDPNPPISAASPELAAASDAFYAAIEARAVAEPEVAAYFLSGLDDERAHELRDRLADRAPSVIAYGLRGMADEHSWQLRERLADVAPYFVARSVDGLLVEGPRAERMRLRFVDSQPSAVLATVDGVDTDAAWSLRDRLNAALPRDVLTSIKRIDSDRAWALRDAYAGSHEAGALFEDPYLASPLVQSLRSLAGERAWTIRRRALDISPTKVLWSLTGLLDDESWELRARYATQAAKIVFRTFDSVDDPRAWELRQDHVARVKEAVDSLSGLDADVAWELRERTADIWPSTTMKSMGLLVATERGAALARRLLADYPGNISLLKHATRAVSRSAATAGLSKAG